MPLNQYPNLKKPPIAIAILEIRYTYNGKRKIDDFSKLNYLLHPDYPFSHAGQSRSIEVDENIPTDYKATISKPHTEDYVYTSKDKSVNFKVTLNRFNFTANYNYSGWDNFIGECNRLWNIFIENFFNNEIDIKGISIRFVNKIVMHDDITSPIEVFKTSISSTEDIIPTSVNNYLIRYVIPYVEQNSYAIVMQSLETSDNNEYPFIFDIDVVCNHDILHENLWQQFEVLRGIKNKIFFSNITERALSQYL